jgi:arylsulfatase A-like enzyme
MNRREFLTLSSAAALASCTEPPQTSKREKPPNIVFIMADDLGYAHLGSYGQTEIRTPRLDAFARQSLRFTQAYSGCTVCAPARSSLMTGLHTGHTPVRGNSGGLPLPGSSVTVAEVLKAAGYATGIFGKWGLGEAGTEGVPELQGFDETLGPLHQIHAQYYYPEFLWKNGSPLPLPENENGRKGRYAPDVMLGGALDFLRNHAAEPFFLYFPSIVPHHEFQVPDENLQEYAGRYQEQPFIREDRGFEVQPQPAAAFAGMVTRLDSDVGKLLDEIDRLGIADNTVVFFTSDNGPVDFAPIDRAFHGNGPLRGHKTDLYEGGIRVPMLVRWPGHIQPGVSDFPWAFWDFLPTAADLAGAEPPASLDGQSIAPTLLGREQAPHDFLYWETERSGVLHQAVRMGPWKALRFGEDAPLELYNLESDPGETSNVAAANPDVIAQIEAYLASARTPPPALVEPGWSKPVPA